MGKDIAKEMIAQGAKVFITSRKACEIEGCMGVIEGIDVTDNNVADKLVKGLNGMKVDVLVNNAGYFYGPLESIDALNFPEEIKMIDICALGPLRITAAIHNAGLFADNAKVRRCLITR